MTIGSELPDIDLKIQCIGFCRECGDPIMENERIIRTEAGLYCESCAAQEDSN